MRAFLLGVLFSAATLAAHAEIEPETIRVERLRQPQPTWFFAKAIMGHANLFDAATGGMLGLVSLTAWTPAVQPNPDRNEIYAAETYYSRLIRGERNDVLTIYDTETLAPVHEIDIPDKIAALPFRHYIGLLDDDRHLVVFNMTPGQSVSVVDVQGRRFVGEISTPGCALVLPSTERSFLMLCGDGTLQLIRLNRQGEEIARQRSDVFFDVATDPVFDKPVATASGWLLVSYEGRVFDVSVDGGNIGVGDAWSLLDEADREAGWRIGGGQVMAYHQGRDLLFTLMHVGGPDTHEEPGTEVWLFDREARRRVGRILLEAPASTMHVTGDADSLLVVAQPFGPIDIYDTATLRKVRSIAEPGVITGLLQGFQP